jgi:hypothetical protein
LGKNFSDVNPIMLKLMEQINNDWWYNYSCD